MLGTGAALVPPPPPQDDSSDDEFAEFAPEEIEAGEASPELGNGRHGAQCTPR